MKRPDDETLMTFADGLLDPERAAEVARWLEKDKAAGDTVAALRRTTTLARDAFDDPIRQKPPQHLIDTILDAPGSSRTEDTVVDLRSARKGWRGGFPQSGAPMALAASVALAIGVSVGLFLGGSGRDESQPSIALGALSAAHPVAQALTRSTSGTSVPLGGALTGRSVTILATFLDGSQRPCREFEIAAADSSAPQTVALACRAGPAWRVDGAMALGAAPQGGAGGFSPAGSERADPLAGILAHLGAGAALSPDQEAALIARSWKPSAE